MFNDINLIKRENSLFFKLIKSKEEISNDCNGFLIDADEKEVRRILSFLKTKEIKKRIALFGKDEMFNRRVIETINFDYLVSPEFNSQKDSLKQRSSGLNHYLTKKMKEKNIAVLISFDLLFKQDKKMKAVLISRIMQNINLCKKTNTDIKIASLSKENFFSVYERERFGISLGMSSQQSSKCCEFQ